MMASTQVVSLNSVAKMKRVHFPPVDPKETLDTGPVPLPVPHFISPRKILRATYQRKRSFSLSFENNKNHHFKRRRKAAPNEEYVRTTKFLLGGNSRDPLNLGSLADEKVNRALNEHTPESSPLPTPKHRKEEIEVLIAPNIRDPLNLSVPDDDLAERALISPNGAARKKRGRNRKRRRTISASEVLEAGQNPPEIKTDILDLISSSKKVKSSSSTDKEEQDHKSHKDKSTKTELKELKLKLDSRFVRRPEDKIVSPVVPQPGTRKRCGFFVRADSKNAKSQSNANSSNKIQPAAQSREVKKFQYGNYDRYYGYRNPGCEDVRLLSFSPEWFQGLDVLDIGCNAGHVTLSVARDFRPRKITGIDIDPKLIASARKSVKSYAKVHPHEKDFPISLPLMFGPILNSSTSSSSSTSSTSTFPNNVSFVHGNYVPENEEFLQMTRPEYDTILCLSVTKWIHLNWKDAGLQRFFKRIYANLRPGGRLILEAQGWASYNRRKKLTETISQNYAAIQLYPERFGDYLLSQVGFSTCEEIATSHHSAKGFRRPIHIFTKAQQQSQQPPEEQQQPPEEQQQQQPSS